MPIEAKNTANWKEPIIYDANKSTKSVITDKGIETSNIRDILPSASLDQSFYAPIHHPPKLQTITLPHAKERHITKQSIDSSNLYTSPLHNYSLPSKNNDYVWLDPTGCVVSPPVDYPVDCGLKTASDNSHVPSINISFSNNIRKV